MIDLLAAGFLLGVTHAVPPGPITVEVLRRGAAEGFVSSLKANLGAVLADTVFFILVMLGLMQILDSSTGKILVWICGCALLLFLGVRGIYRALNRNDTNCKDPPQKARTLSSMATGFIICISSPFAIIWWISVFTSSITLFSSSAGAMITMFAGIAVACFLWYALIGFSGAAGKKMFSPGAMKMLSLACSAMMIVFAAVLFYRGYTTLL